MTPDGTNGSAPRRRDASIMANFVAPMEPNARARVLENTAEMPRA